MNAPVYHVGARVTVRDDVAPRSHADRDDYKRLKGFTGTIVPVTDDAMPDDIANYVEVQFDGWDFPVAVKRTWLTPHAIDHISDTPDDHRE